MSGCPKCGDAGCGLTDSLVCLKGQVRRKDMMITWLTQQMARMRGPLRREFILDDGKEGRWQTSKELAGEMLKRAEDAADKETAR